MSEQNTDIGAQGVPVETDDPNAVNRDEPTQPAQSADSSNEQTEPAQSEPDATDPATGN